MSYIRFNIGWFSLLFSNGQNWTQGVCIHCPSYVLSFLFLSYCCHFSCVDRYFFFVVFLFWWCPQSLLSFLWSLFHQCRLPCNYCGFLCVIGSAVFSWCHSLCVFLFHSRIICCLPAMGVAVSGSSFLSASVLPYIIVSIFLGTLPYILLTFHFLHSFAPLCRPMNLASLCMKCCLVSVHSFSVLGVDCLLSHAGLLLAKFWYLLYIL